MKKPILTLLCTVLSIGAAMGAKAPQPKAIQKAVQYEVKLKSQAFGDMGTRKMWIKGENIRWEYMSGGLPLKLIKNKEGLFLLHPWNKTAGKYPKGTNRENPLALFPGPTGPVDDFLKSVKAVKQSTEKIGDQTCTVYSYKEPIDHRLCKIWISNSTRKPVKLTTNGAKGAADPITATYTKFVVGASMPDSLFQLPKDSKIRPMPASRLTSNNSKDRKGPV